METLPNLFVVGAAKAGTTALYHYFKAHPDIFVPESIKETNFMAFSNGVPNFTGPGDSDHSAMNGITSLSAYIDLYREGAGKKISADISPAYLYYPQASRKIAELCPAAKVVIILRNPVESVFSMYSMMRRDGREPCDSFREAFQRTPERLAAGWEWAWDYQAGFFFSPKVSRYLELFPASQLFIRRYEELNENPESFHAELMNFLGVDYQPGQGSNQRFNESPQRVDVLGKYQGGELILKAARVFGKVLPEGVRADLKKRLPKKPAYHLEPEDRHFLIDHFSADIGKLSTLLQWNLSDWLKK